jgi:hypothetical protein
VLVVFFLPGKPKVPEVESVRIPGNESPGQHTGTCLYTSSDMNDVGLVYVWDHFAKKAAAAEIVIVAHSGTPVILITDP